MTNAQEPASDEFGRETEALQTPTDDGKIGRRGLLGLAAAVGLLGPAAFDLVLSQARAVAATTGPIYQFPFSPSTTIVPGGLFGDTTQAPHSPTRPHRGRDFTVPAGSAIPAVADGRIVRNAYNTALGNIVLIDHGDEYYSGYCHMQAPSSLAVGATVARGQTIGLVGSTGTATTGPHLHLTIGKDLANPDEGITQDPYEFISARLSSTVPSTPINDGEEMRICKSQPLGSPLPDVKYWFLSNGTYREISSEYYSTFRNAGFVESPDTLTAAQWARVKEMLVAA